MITKGLITLLVKIIAIAAKLLPDYTPPPSADLSAFQMLAWLVPINELVSLAALMAAFAFASLLYFAVNWSINKAMHSG